MKNLLPIVKKTLQKTGLNELARRSKQKLKRQLRKEDIAISYLPVRSFLVHSQAALTEMHQVTCGTKAIATTRVLPPLFNGTSAVLEVSYTVTSLDYTQNWFTIKIHSENPNGMDLRGLDGLSLFFDSAGGGGQFLVSLRDQIHGLFSYNAPNVLHQQGIQQLQLPFSDFFRPPWEEQTPAPMILANVQCLEFSVKPGDTPIPFSGKFRICGFAGLKDPLTDFSAAQRICSAITLDDLSQGVEERFYASTGKDASLTFMLDQKELFQGRPSLRLNYEILSGNHTKNWVTLFRDLTVPIDKNDISGILIYVKGSCRGETLRISLQDGHAVELTVDDRHCLQAGQWQKLYIPLHLFSPPWWRTTHKDHFSFQELQQLSVSILIHHDLYPHSSSLLLGGLFVVRHSEPLAIAADNEKSEYVIDHVMVDMIWQKPLEESNVKTVIEQDSLGPYLHLTCNKNANSAKIRFSLDEERNHQITTSTTLYLRHRGDKPKPAAITLISPDGGQYYCDSSTITSYGAEWLQLFAIRDFHHTISGISFTETAHTLGYAKEIIIHLDSQTLFHHLRQLGRGGASPEATMTHFSAISKEEKNAPISETKTEKTAETGIQFRLAPTPPPKTILEPEALKKADDISGGEYGLCRIACFIEPTNLCNLRCIMCNHGDNSFRRGLGVMKFRDFKRITAEIKEEKLKFWELSPFWLGESFIHPQIGDFLKEASILKDEYQAMEHFNIHTNGVNLTEKHLQAAAASSLSSILFSLDAATEETYNKIRRGGRFEGAVAAAEQFLALRTALEKTKPALITQFIVMDENAHEIADFANFWRKKGINRLIYAGPEKENPFRETNVQHDLLFPQTPVDSIFIKSLEPNALTKKQKHREAIEDNNCTPDCRFACSSLFRMLSIAWDGEATACCRDDQIDMPIGNVLKDGLISVWYGEKLRELRLKHIMGDFTSIPKCASCVNWVKNPVHSSEILHWLKSINREDLAGPYLTRTRKQS